MTVALRKIKIDGGLGLFDGFVIAVMNDRTRHTAEDRFYHIEELGPGG